MKKVSILAAIAMGFAAASCSSDEPATAGVNANKQIGFTVTADNGSRSISSYENGLSVKDFYVSAWIRADKNAASNYVESNNGNSAYFTNDYLTRTAGAGSFNYTSGARYWPANGEILDFFAVVDNKPFDVEFAFNAKSSGVPGLDGAIAQKAINEMPDMLYATVFGDSLANYRGPQKNVSLHFNHAFAKVEVTAEVVNPNLRVCITEMEIHGIIAEGDFYFPHREDANGNPTAVVPAKWVIDNNGEYTHVVCPIDDTIIIDGNEKATLLGKGVTADSKNDELLVIPNSYDGRNSSGKYQTYIQLKGYAYNISNADNGYKEGVDRLIYPAYDDPTTGAFTPATMIIPIEFNWQMGTVNHYNLVFDCGNGGSVNEDPNNPAFIRIGYEVEVNGWNEGETKDPAEYIKK